MDAVLLRRQVKVMKIYPSYTSLSRTDWEYMALLRAAKVCIFLFYTHYYAQASFILSLYVIKAIVTVYLYVQTIIIFDKRRYI